MVVVHGILVSIVIVLDVCGYIMGRIDVELVIENVSRGVRCEDMGNKGLARHLEAFVVKSISNVQPVRICSSKRQVMALM
jgi:hypothetical protein